jgi:hypothetical protein
MASAKTFSFTPPVKADDLPKIAGPWLIVERSGCVQYMVRYHGKSTTELAKVSPTAAGKWVWIVRSPGGGSGYMSFKDECIECVDKSLKNLGFMIVNKASLLNLL